MKDMASNVLKSKENFVYPEREWAYRLLGVVVIFLFVLSLSLIAVTVRDNIISHQFDKMMKGFYHFFYQKQIFCIDV